MSQIVIEELKIESVKAGIAAGEFDEGHVFDGGWFAIMMQLFDAAIIPDPPRPTTISKSLR
ncbi:hypothetical protein C0989_011729 [Termitomyces sp. Mn162]|nr:hypothetical protein C0989_011729 [Termitomyces sp. Mn162]